MKRASRGRLDAYNLPDFQGSTLFDRLGRVVCRASCLPRKEFFEAWAFTRRVNRKLKGGRLVDLACGHGLAAYCMLLMDRHLTEAFAIDRRLPLSAGRLTLELEKQWPQLAGKVQYREMRLEAFELQPDDLVISVHACGDVTDRVLEKAMAVGARVAVLPCCQAESRCDTGDLLGWIDVALAVDVTRVARMRAAGYTVRTATIPDDITPKNRILLGYLGAPK